MKPLASIGLFIMIGLLTALVTGFSTDMLFTQPAYDEEQSGLNQRIIIKFSHVVAENTPKGLSVEKFSQLVKEKTNGRVEVQVFPNGILYSDNTEQEALMRGEIQMIAPAFSKLATLIPEWMAMDLPYAFRDEKDVEKAFRGSIGRMLFQTLEPYNMKGLAFWSNGFKQITSNRPILQPQDFAGQRFRIMSTSRVLEAQFRALGVEAVGISFNDLYHKLENGEVDGQENTISNIYTKRLYQVQKHMTLSNHGYLGYAVIVNKAFWDKLPPDIQAKLTEAMQEATQYNKKLAVWMNEQQLRQIRETSGLSIHELTPAERDAWKQAMQPVYKQFTPIIGEELMSEIQKLQEQR
jgi:tripartite ATP-independent transporter DctP family solute receptor